MEYRLFEESLSRLHRVAAPDDVKAFRARLKILRDVGAIDVPKPGKGSRVDYSFDDLLIGHLALIFDDAGFPPSTIKELMTKIAASKILARLKEHHSAGPNQPDQWLRAEALRYQFSDEGRLAHVWLAPLKEQFDFLQAQELSKVERRQPAFQHSLVNLSNALADCWAVIPQ